MKSNLIALLCFIIFVIGCSKKKSVDEDYNKGNLTVIADGSFKSVTEALAEGYSLSYPETKITVLNKKEDLAFLDLVHDKAKLIVMSRELNSQEKQTYTEQTGLKFNPSKFAADAVVFVVPKNSTIESLSMEEINKEILSNEKRFIFDGTNSSNLNFVAQKLNKQPSELQYSIISGNENVIEQLYKFPNKIGVIGYNTFSRPYGKEAQMLREKVKMLPISEKGKMQEPTLENLKEMTYPFTRVLYFLENEGGFGLANGFMRFSCTQLGQMIVSKEGLQPYYIFKREVQMR